MSFLWVWAVDKSVDHRARGIVAIGQCRDCLPHQPLGVIHHRAASGGKALIPVALNQCDEPLGANPRGGDLRFHVADDEVGDADIVTQQLPYSVVADAAVVPAHCLRYGADLPQMGHPA